MDKYEYKLKMDEIKSLAGEKRYEEAAVIVDSINWRKVRNVNSLVKAGEIYAQVGRYEEAKEILLMAYDRSPIGRMIIYRLAEVAIKQKNFEEAQEYYDEFVEIAPHDNLKYVLRYEINRAKEAGIDVLIGILEELKDQEYTERWAFELAFLYHKAGKSEQCIDACDELILWFGDGPYVEKALELKMLYQPLNKAQEDKYRKFKQHRDGIVEVRPTDTLESGEIIRETVQIPQVTTNASKFNTVNLQQELAKSMQQIMEATEKETVSDTMDNIKKIVEEIPYLQIPQEEGAEEQLEEKYGHIETDEEIDGSLRTNFQELLGEEYDGQLSLVMPERALLEKQITGQMNIQDVLEEWERTRRAAEAALQEAEQRKLESAKAKALAQAEDIMDRLATVIPQLDAGMTPKDLLEQEYLGKAAAMDSAEIAGMMTKHRPKEEAGQLMADVNSILQQQIDELFRVNEGIDEFLTAGILPENLKEGFTNEAAISEGFADEMPMPEDLREGIEDEQRAQEDIEGSVSEELQHELPEEDFLPEMTAALEAEIAAMTDEEEPSHEAEESNRDFSESYNMEEEEIPLPKIQLEPEAMEAPGGDTKELPKISKLEFEDEPEEDIPITRLSERQREIFTYFTPVMGMEQQLCQVLTGAKKHLKDAKSCKAGNIIIQGVRGSGKTVLATSIIKALQEEIGRPSSKVGKIDAVSLNQKDIPQLLKKIQGGCLIIEKVGDISRETAVKLSLALEADSSGILVIIEDTRTGINKAMGRDESLARKFTEKINLPIFTSDELVSFAKSYAKELMFEIDDMAMLALYNRISNIQKVDQATTLTEVKEIVDEAIANAEKFSMKKAFGLFASRKSKDSDYEILHEKDFEE